MTYLHALGGFAIFLALGSSGSAADPDWQSRLSGDSIVMLGEVHDNAGQHQLRLERLQKAFADGWRPAIAMEQFDRDHQADIDRARRERPKDVDHLLELAAPGESEGAGWNWKFYRPFVQLALDYDVPLIAVNLSRADAGKVVKDGYSAVFDPDTLASLGLSEPLAPDWVAAQEREIEIGHCHQLPPSMLPAMASAQFARDAVMASMVQANAGHGLVLLAGNGHVRRDIGVPRRLGPSLRSRVFSVGYLESGNAAIAPAFDAVVITAAASRPDPCLKFRKPAADR
jgi:uncharacterized iron-regulated protein